MAIADADSSDATITVPANASPGETIHLVCEVTDHGTPALTRYQRAVVTIVP